MCGIFGFVGKDANPAMFLEALKRLEYRGYDSWGITMGTTKNDFEAWKKAGRTPGSTPVSDKSFWGGIAHTRWATHGAPTDRNAHPHHSAKNKIASVHNGIIENFTHLRSGLNAKGIQFASETDSEVIPQLVEDFMSQGLSFKDAFFTTLKTLQGTFGIAMIHQDHPGILLAARRGSPLILGIADEGLIITSDATALITHTRNAIYLEDGEVVIIEGSKYETMDLLALPIAKQIEKLTIDLPSIERGGYDHFMQKEIFEQPEAIANALRGRIIRNEATCKFGGLDQNLLRKIKRVHFVACGTSWHASLVGKILIEQLAGIPSQVSYAAEFRYGNPIIEPDTLVIAISQSGETADTLAAIREAKLRGAHTFGICNVVGSTIARECGQGAYLHAGPEIGVASTKAFTCQIAVLALLAVGMGRLHRLSLHEALTFINALEALPAQVTEVLKQDSKIKEIAQKLTKSSHMLYIGRGVEFPVALEGALKLKEISYIYAEGLQAAELKHGPIALIDQDMPVVCVAASQQLLEKIQGNIHEIKARGGKIISIVSQGDSIIAPLSDELIEIPSTHDLLTPILSVLPLQMLSYHVAVARGCDVDKPRNLAKSVTVE